MSNNLDIKATWYDSGWWGQITILNIDGKKMRIMDHDTNRERTVNKNRYKGILHEGHVTYITIENGNSRKLEV